VKVEGLSKTHISVQKLNVFYDRHHVLKDVSLDIPEKQITVIIGPSGCGKTTLLKSLDRLIELTENVEVNGRILFNGVNVLDRQVDVLDIRKRMGLIAQTPSPLPMSIYDNIAYGPRVHGTTDKKELDEIVERCLQVLPNLLRSSLQGSNRDFV
jgi:phosphate transport system ATP-binding protein